MRRRRPTRWSSSKPWSLDLLFFLFLMLVGNLVVLFLVSFCFWFCFFGWETGCLFLVSSLYSWEKAKKNGFVSVTNLDVPRNSTLLEWQASAKNPVGYRSFGAFSHTFSHTLEVFWHINHASTLDIQAWLWIVSLKCMGITSAAALRKP